MTEVCGPHSEWKEGKCTLLESVCSDGFTLTDGLCKADLRKDPTTTTMNEAKPCASLPYKRPLRADDDAHRRRHVRSRGRRVCHWNHV